MNVYHVGRCPVCGHPEVLDGQTGECGVCGAVMTTDNTNVVMTHGWDVTSHVLRLLVWGQSVDGVGRDLCACCGHFYSPNHGCADPRPQRS